MAEQQQVANEILTNIRTVRAYDQELREGNRYMAVSVRSYRIGIFLVYLGQVYGVCNMIVSYIATMLVYWLGAEYCIYGTMKSGDLIAFISFVFLC